VKASLLVVEDNPDSRLLLTVLLSDHYDLSEAATGPEALESMRAERPELVLLDIGLPGMDGVEVLTEMKADAQLAGVPVIVLTARAMAGDREEFLAKGFDDYVSKPIVDEQLLIDAIERLLARRSAT
jgi:CheY-like chemotaxis protein